MACVLSTKLRLCTSTITLLVDKIDAIGDWLCGPLNITIPIPVGGIEDECECGTMHRATERLT